MKNSNTLVKKARKMTKTRKEITANKALEEFMEKEEPDAIKRKASDSMVTVAKIMHRIYQYQAIPNTVGDLHGVRTNEV